MPIFDVHHPWVLTFGLLGNIISIFVYFSPLPTFIQIYRRKSTLGFQSVPYVLALFSAMLWIFYAFLKTDAVLLISINSIGCVIETIYIVVFLFYATKDARKQTVKLVGSLNVVVFAAIFLFTMFTEKGAYRVQVVGWICVAVSVCVFAAPLSIVFQVVRTKSVEFMPLSLSLTLTLSAVLWFAYGLLQKDLYVAVPNVLGFILGILQMVLYGIYRSPKGVKEVLVVELEKKVPEHVINVVTTGSGPEVYPAADDSLDSVTTTTTTTTAAAAVTENENVLTTLDDHKDEENSENRYGEEKKRGDDQENEKSVASIPHLDDHQPYAQQLNAKLESPALIVCSA